MEKLKSRIVEKQIYICSDDAEFEDEQEAIEHQKYLNIYSIIDEFYFSGLTKSELVQELVKYSYGLKKFL